MLDITTPQFVEALVNGKIDLDEKVNISARELLAIMTENIELSTENNKRLAENTKEINNLKTALKEYKERCSALERSYNTMYNNFVTASEQEKIQRDRANLLQKQVPSSITVSYTKGDLLDFMK